MGHKLYETLFFGSERRSSSGNVFIQNSFEDGGGKLDTCCYCSATLLTKVPFLKDSVLLGPLFTVGTIDLNMAQSAV